MGGILNKFSLENSQHGAVTARLANVKKQDSAGSSGTTSHRKAAKRTKHGLKPRRRIGVWVWLLLAIVGLGGVLYGVDYVMSEGRVPRGVTVGGVDIGGMTEEQAEQRLRIDLGEKMRKPVNVKAGNMSTELDPPQSGLQVDWEATVKQAGQQPLNPITRIRSFFDKREVGIISAVADQPFNRTMERLSRDLTRQPENAELSLNDRGKPDVKDDVPGQTIDPNALREVVLENWLNKDRTVNAEADVTEAEITSESADKLVREVVNPATSKPILFKGRDDVVAEIKAADMAKILTFVPNAEKKEDATELRAEWNNEAAQEILQAQLAGTEKEFRNASFTTEGGSLSVVPHQDGISIKWDETLGKIEDKALNTRTREWDVVYEDKKAEYTTEEAQNASFDDTVGEFTTGGFSGPSGVNIRRTAEMVNGAYVLPGETFSLNGYTGPRGTAQGFVESGIIIDGRASEAVGGGISQFATTLYNAAYFAGMEDVAHTPHSYYISRYPAGREATVYEGAIDLQFKNTFDTPVRIEAFVSGDSVTVRLKGVKTVEVESITGSRTNPTQPQKMKVDKDDHCTPSSGAPGFTISDTRVIKNLNGRELSRETQTTVYDPQPIVSCV
ncbi:VanW like protein [Corynebacterium urogenitale]|uniref:VanW like protein n=2 Tax=Corynebacterium urogenitale TaxID=2487892 RepID=A0A5J6Z3K3_9CORY|nr:VanW like protein [Corynebacterium urogenitale]